MKWNKKVNDSVDYINGYPISEVWGTYHYLAQEIVPRLKAFKALDKHGHCPAFNGIPEWNKAIQKMIDAFELLKQITTYSEEEEQTIEKGLNLFCKHFRNLWDKNMNRKDLINNSLSDYSIKAIEREIINRYNSTRCYDSDDDYLLLLRRNIINKKVLAHQKELLPDIIVFNDALREALRDMYDRAHRIWNKVVQNIDETDGEEMELTAKCYFDYTYPELHPIQSENRQDLWEALCDGDLNPLYADGISVLTLTFPRDEGLTFDSFIGMDCPPPNWNEGLDQELTKDLHLINQFHTLFQHMNFAITDFIYVKEFKTEIKIEII